MIDLQREFPTIKNSGKTCIVHNILDKEYFLTLEEKLNEEVAEYLKDKNIEEMADGLKVQLINHCKNKSIILE